MNKKILLSVVLLSAVLLLTFAAYSPVLKNNFITNDDPGHLLNNDLVRSLSAENIRQIFLQTPNKTYVPLTTLSFALEYHFFGFAPFFYHLDNLLLHLSVVSLIFIIAVRWFALSPWVAAFAALLFGIHPMHVESVAWVTERKDVLYAVFYLWAIDRYCAYLKNSLRRNYYLTLIFALLSILAKPMALSLPLVLCVLDWYLRRPINIRVFAEKVPYFLIIVPVSWVTYALNARAVGSTPLETVLTWIWSCMFYPQKFFFPDVLLTVYSLPKPVSLFNGEFLKAVVLFVITGMALFVYRKNRWLLFAVLYYFVSIFFLLRFDDKADVNFVADRFMYLSSLGICLALGVSLEWFLKRIDRKMVVGFVVIVFFFLGGRTFAQTKIWGDGVLLWSGVVDHYPDCFNAYDHRGFAYGQQGHFEKAIKDYDQALRLKAKYMPAYHNRALAYSQLGEDQKALADFDKAFELDPVYAKGYFNRGIFYAQRGEYEKAIADYTRAIEETNDLYVEAYSNRGTVYLSQKSTDEALKDFDRALALDPRDSFARNNRAIAFVQKGENDAALKDLTEALKFAPKDAETYFNRGLVYSRLDRSQEALADFKKALELNPRHKLAIKKALEIEKKLGM